MPATVFVLVAVVAAVGTLQGAAWLGAPGSDERARRRGAWLTPIALAGLALGLLGALVPGFFGH